MASYASQSRTFFYNLKKYGFSFSIDELKQMAVTIGVVAFVWSFNKWGEDGFDPVIGLTNVALGVVYATIGLFLNQVGQRIVAVYYGYDPQYEYGAIGLMIALVVAFASRGYLIFFLPGQVNIRHLAASRLGEFRYYTNDWEWAKAGFQGPFWNMILAMVLYFFSSNVFMRQLMVLNIMFAIYSLIPLPGNVGLYIFYPHIYFWSYTFGVIMVGSLLTYFLAVINQVSLVLAVGVFLLSAGAGVGAMYYHFEKIDNKYSLGWGGGGH